MVVLRILMINRHFNVVKLILTDIHPSIAWWPMTI